MLPQPSFERRMFPLALIQFFTAFNGYAFMVLFALLLPWSGDLYLRDSMLLFLITLTGTIPFALFYSPSGMFSDFVPKRYVIILCKIVEFLLLVFAAFAVHNIDSWSVFPTLGVVFGFLIIKAFMTPALNSIMPETFGEKELSRAVGKLGGISFWGALAGIGSILIAHSLFKSPVYSVVVLGCATVISFIASLRISPVISALQRRKELAYSFRRSFSVGWREVTRTPSILLSTLGDSASMGLGAALMMLLMLFSKYTLNDGGGAVEIAFLQAAPIIGIGMGCYFAGRLSINKIELGLVPLGAAGVAVMLVMAAYFPGEPSYFSIAVPGLFDQFDFHVHIPAMIWLLLAGFCGGMFVIPLRSFFLQRVRPERRAAAQAVASLLGYVVLAVINFIVISLALGIAKDIGGLPEFIRAYGEWMPSLSPQTLIVGLGAFTFLVTIFTMWALPDFALRFIIITLGNIFYRNRISGVDNIPERGPALLLANHASYIDSILISASTSRRIRFLMNEDFFKIPLLSPIARLTGFISVPSSGKHKSMAMMLEQVKQILRNGDIVCVFPEGRITRNGIIGRFKGGYRKMLPEGMDVPVIPVNVGGAWGSIFSYYKGDIRPRMPKSFPYHVSVTFGAPLAADTTPFEVRQTVCELSAEAAKGALPDECVIHYALAHFAKRHPFQIYMRDADGKSFSYFKTFVASILMSREIRKMTSSNCKYVGVLLPNSTAAALAMLGTLIADKVPCPLNFTTSQDVFETSVKKASITCILTSRRFLDKINLTETPEMVFLEDLVKKIPSWKKLLAVLGIIFIPWRELINMLSPLSCKDITATGALLFSSGSTGVPKGVMLSHHNIYSDIYAMKQAVAFEPCGDKIVGILPLFHSFGMTTCFWLPLMLRSEVVYVNSPLDATTVGKVIEKNGITMLFATPSFLQTYMRKCKVEQFKTLRLVITGAEKLRSDISERFHEMMGGRLKIVEGYGCTELSPVVTINLAEKLKDLGAQFGKAGAIGVSMDTICSRIVDPLTYKPVPPEAEGLLFVKGPMVMQGYLGEPEKTAEVIVNGYYNTGDIAKMDERGYITICGRLSRFSKIAGEMVPHELVECIINEMLGLEQRVVAVASIPDIQKGEALLVLHTDEMPIAPDKVVEQLRERSISNLWIPKATNFCRVEHLPLLGSGKLDLSALRQMAEGVAVARNLPIGGGAEPRKSPEMESLDKA